MCKLPASAAEDLLGVVMRRHERVGLKLQNLVFARSVDGGVSELLEQDVGSR